MQELLVDFITSLDGYGAAEGWPGWWGLEGPEYLAWLGEQPERDYTILMGANTYRLMSGSAAEAEVTRPHGTYRSTRHAPRFVTSHCCANRRTFPGRTADSGTFSEFRRRTRRAGQPTQAGG